MTYQKYKHMHNTGTVSRAIVKQSSRYVIHSLYGCVARWQHIVLCKTHGKIVWTDEAIFINMR